MQSAGDIRDGGSKALGTQSNNVSIGVIKNAKFLSREIIVVQLIQY